MPSRAEPSAAAAETTGGRLGAGVWEAGGITGVLRLVFLSVCLEFVPDQVIEAREAVGTVVAGVSASRLRLVLLSLLDLLKLFPGLLDGGLELRCSLLLCAGLLLVGS